MGVLSSKQIRNLTEGPQTLLSDYVNLDEQLQPNGVDLTLGSIAKPITSGRIGIDNSQRVLSELQELNFDESGYLNLPQGVYIARLNETVALPENLMAIAKPRSSLLRNGVAVNNAVWDAGYIGKSQVQIVVHPPEGFVVSQNARIIQMVFMTLDESAEFLYSGQYQGEATSESKENSK